MVSSLLDNILTRTDTLLERLFHQPENEQTVSFKSYLTDPRKILLIPGDNLADLALSLDFFQPILHRFPMAALFVLLSPEQTCLIGNIRRVWPIACPHRSTHTFDSVFRKTVSLLRAEEFDWAVNLTYSGRPEALLTYHSGAKIRAGLPFCGNDKYYNLIVKNIPEEENFSLRFGHLFKALQVKEPFRTDPALFRPAEKELLHAENFFHHCRRAKENEKIVGCVIETLPGQKSLDRSLLSMVESLAGELDLNHLFIADNLFRGEDRNEWNEIKDFLIHFDDLRQMLTALTYCDRVITNSVGTACLLARLGVQVGLMETDSKYLARLGSEDLARIDVLTGR
ncbi:MAG: hypothetical protein U9N45_02310 [Gemmatimonadota bacterium]|nr:hypothetical protein [Gemmatimonadota bacterium]